MRPPLNAGENPLENRHVRAPDGSFNEAPAERGGEHDALRDNAMPIDASMRPPLNAGENTRQAVAHRGVHVASMRPPLNAGENVLQEPQESHVLGLASMRPPLNAGENRDASSGVRGRRQPLQ